MRILKVILIPALAMLFTTGASHVYAQATATASISATITTPIALSKSGDMNFGNAAVSMSAGGSVVLSPSGARSTGGSGVTLPSNAGTVSAAGFMVVGMPNFTYAITLPSSAVISGPGAATMTVSSFTSIPAATGTLNSSGTQALAVGATLNIAPGQPSGIYTNMAAVPVTVNYN